MLNQSKKLKFQLFLSKAAKSKELLIAIVFALTCAAMTLDYNDQAEIKAVQTCDNAVFAFDNPNICEG